MTEEVIIKVGLNGEESVDKLAENLVKSKIEATKLSNELKLLNSELKKLKEEDSRYSQVISEIAKKEVVLANAKIKRTSATKELMTATKQLIVASNLVGNTLDNINTSGNKFNKIAGETLKMKTAFDVVNSSLNVASLSGDKFISKMLSIRFPEVGKVAQKEVQILYQAFSQAERIGSGMFDMASVAAKVFKGDITQVNNAVVQYNELFEKNSGVDGIILNTSALLSLRNQVIATGSSVSLMNKELSNLGNNNIAENITQQFKFTEVSIKKFLEVANSEALDMGADFTLSPQAVQAAWGRASDELRAYTAMFEDSPSRTQKIGDFEMEIPNETKKQLEGYKTSIAGLQEQISALTQHYSLLSEKDRAAFGPDIIKRIENTTQSLNKATQATNKLGVSTARAGKGGFDPLANSIMQMSRELPNFAISANIGFMAISNNLPIMAEAIDNFKKMRAEIIKSNAVAGATQQAVPKMGDAIRKTFLSWGGAATIAAGLFLAFGDTAIKSVIDWLNKIPEKVKVAIEIDTDVFKAMTKDQIKIKTFLNDYNKAIKDSNKERISELENYAKKEFDLTDSSLNKYKTSNLEKLQSSKELFKEYLKVAEDTYYNEAIIKKRVEAQQTGQTSLATAQKLYVFQKSKKGSAFLGDAGFNWKTYLAMANDGSFTESVGEALLVTGVDQRIVDELRIVSAQNAIIKALPKLRDIDMGTGKVKPTNGGSGGGTKVSLDKSLGLDLIKQEAERVSKESFTKPVLDGEIRYTNEELVIMDDNNKKRTGIYDDAVEDQIDYVIRREDARQKDLDNQLAYEYGQKALLQAEVDRFDSNSKEYDNVIADLNSFNNNKTNLLNTNESITEQINNSTDQASIESLNKQKTINLESIALIESDIAAKLLQKTALEAQLKEAEGYPKKMSQITEKIAGLNVTITDSLRTQVEAERDLWQERVTMARDYLDAIGDLAGGLADIAQGNMDLTNAEYDQKIWANDEMIQSDERRSDNAYKIEMERWEALRENFEMQKKMKEAQAWMDFASGSVGIWTAPGITSLAPFGYILAGIQQAALLATTIGNVKTIKSQQMLKPHKGSGGSSGGSSSANIALNPAKDALTSRDENLNTMAKANQKDAPQSVVKVSEINDVQTRVKVREENATY